MEAWIGINVGEYDNIKSVIYMGTMPAGNADIAVLVDDDEIDDWLRASLHMDVRTALLKTAREIRFL